MCEKGGLHTHQSAPDGLRCRLGTVVDLQLHEDAADVLLHGVFGDAEGGGDFFVGVASGDEGEDLAFARGDLGLGKAVLEALFDVGGQTALATSSLAFQVRGKLLRA